MPNQSGKIILVLILVLLILGAGTYFSLPIFKKQAYQESYVAPPVSTPQAFQEDSKSADLTKGYYSKALKISFNIPEGSTVDEKHSYLIIILPNGNISMTFNGTNYENAKEYFDDLKQRNKITPLSYLEGDRKGYSYVLISDEDVDEKLKTEKTYFVYADHGIYAFSTSDEVLYPVLDQIVQSFEYKP
jgi:hypothetical protein